MICVCCYIGYIVIYISSLLNDGVFMPQHDEVTSGTAWSQLGRASRLECSCRPGARCAHHLAKLKPRKPGRPHVVRRNMGREVAKVPIFEPRTGRSCLGDASESREASPAACLRCNAHSEGDDGLVSASFWSHVRLQSEKRCAFW